jgi:O-antigen ligase
VALAFGNPHLLAGYLVISTAVLLGIRVRVRRRYLLSWAGLVGLHVLAVMTTAAYLMVGLVVVLVVWRWGWRYSWGKGLGLGIVVALMALFVIWVMKPTAVFEAEGRGRIWRRGAMAVMEKPILGWGVARFAEAIEAYHWPLRVDDDVYIDKAHASLVEVAVTTGLLGLMIYVWMFGVSMRLGWRTEADWWWVVVVYVLVSQLNIISISTEVVGWIGMGMALMTTETS